MAKDYKELVVGLDIGTAKVMVVVAEVLPDGELKLAGLGVAPSNGLKRGVVVNIDATVQSIQQALKEAELMADCKITRVNVGITGSHIRGINSSGMVAIKDKEVTQADLARVMETARAINIFTARLQATFWSRALSELHASGLAQPGAVYATVAELHVVIAALTLQNPNALHITANDWNAAPALLRLAGVQRAGRPDLRPERGYSRPRPG
jgi:hypothetical protein